MHEHCSYLFLRPNFARAASPVDFGKAELDAAVAERKIRLHVDTELSLNPPETFSITLYKTGLARITGGDLRGLMYGPIEASEQIREKGTAQSNHREAVHRCARRPHDAPHLRSRPSPGSLRTHNGAPIFRCSRALA